MMHFTPGLAVAVPVNNEADLIGPCLRALDASGRGHKVDVLLLLNNCSDGTAAAVRGMSPGLSCRVHVVEQDFPPALANAGQARRLAMAYAAVLAGPNGVLMTTDADSRVAEDWIGANLRALAAGADAVAGRIEIDPEEALLIPAALHEDDARECAYDLLLDEIAWLLDPDPADPWPRHTRESGASIAVTVPAWRSAGGIPGMASGEDRAFFAALRTADARIRHAPEPVVTVSARLWGRACGGMAEAIRRRMVAPDPFIPRRPGAGRRCCAASRSAPRVAPVLPWGPGAISIRSCHRLSFARARSAGRAGWIGLRRRLGDGRSRKPGAGPAPGRRGGHCGTDEAGDRDVRAAAC